MKKTLLLLLLFFFALSLFAQEPIIKFYLNDGSQPKEYNIEEIENIGITKSEISSIMTVFNKVDSLTRYFDLSNINQILFENLQIKFVLTDTTIIQNLSEIDSISIKQKEQKFITVSINNQITNLKLLKVSSYADYNRQFDSLGIAKVLITRNSLPQIIMVSDTANNLIAMGIAKSTDSSIYINGLSSISALVYQNAFMMGMTLEQGVDSVVDFIQNLGEVNYVSSFVDDTIIAGKPFLNALDTNSKSILRTAFIKTYEYATGDTTSYGIINKDKKENKNTILSDILEIAPNERSDIKIDLIKNTDNSININVENKSRRHITIRILDGNAKGDYDLGAGIQITGSLLSWAWDQIIFQNARTIKWIPDAANKFIDGYGPSMNKFLNESADRNDWAWQYPYGRTLVSLLCAPLEVFIKAQLIGIGYDKNKAIIIGGILKDLFSQLLTAKGIYDSPKDVWNIPQLLGLLNNEENMKLILTKITNNVPSDFLVQQCVDQINIFFFLSDFGWFISDMLSKEEVSRFHIYYSGATITDITPPKVEILAPKSSDIQANTVIPINIKITDNENVKKVKLIIDYNSQSPIAEYDFGENAGKEKTYTFNWNNYGLIGTHYITVYGEDASGNSSSTLKIVNISKNPNDHTKPTATITEPTTNKIPNNSIIPITINAKDNDFIQFISCWIDNSELLWAERYDVITNKDINYRFNWNTYNLTIGTKHIIHGYVIDGNFNTTNFSYEVEIVKSDNTIPINGLTSYFPFNGNANDEGGNGNHGTVYGATLTTDRFGKLNSAYTFNGTSNYIKLAGKFGGGKEMTVSAWFNVNGSTGTFQAIFESEGAYSTNGNIHLQCNTYGNNVVYYNTGYCLLPILLPTPYNQWRHVVITAKSGDIRLYENGVQKAKYNDKYDLISISDKVDIGRGTQGRYFKGQIDDVRVYNRALSESEVQALYNEK